MIFPFSAFAFNSLPSSFESLTTSLGNVVMYLVYSVFPTFLSRTSRIFISQFRNMKYIKLSVPERNLSKLGVANLTAQVIVKFL